MAALQPPVPKPTPAFDPSTTGMDGGFGWRLSQGAKALQASAAQRGTLLTGATQKALVDYGQHVAAGEYGDAYNRALDTYKTNRDTNTLNYGQARTSYQDSLPMMSPVSYLPPSYGTGPDAGGQQAAFDRQHAEQQSSQVEQATAQADRNRARVEQDRDLAQRALSTAMATPRSWAEPQTPRPFVLSQPSVDPYASERAQQGDQNARLHQQYAAIVAEQERRQRERDAQIREQTAREQAAIPPQLKPIPYLPYVGVGRG